MVLYTLSIYVLAVRNAAVFLPVYGTARDVDVVVPAPSIAEPIGAPLRNVKFGIELVPSFFGKKR